MRRRFGALSAGVLTVALVASGCSETTADNNSGGSQEAKVQTGTIATDPAESQGPAKAVAGAAKGGVVKLLHAAEFEHLDPQKIYVSDALSMATQFARTLTGYKEDGSGNLKLVGDLATNAGEDVNGDCKVWKYTLKDGLKFEDGTPITAQDVAYGISRSFDPDWGDGPTYVQQWLTGSVEYNTTYKGPFLSPNDPIPGVKVDGEKVITFTFPAAQCETPYAVAMPTSAPVPKAKDTKGDYDRKPVSSGPYMIKEHAYDQFIDFVRNPHWDEKTDPIRNAYPEGIRVEFGIDAENGANRVAADAAEDQTAFIWANVPAAVLPKTRAPEFKERVKNGPSQYVEYTYINMDRVKDINVRKALNLAADRDAILKIRGGVDTFGSTLLSPTIAGYQNYNVYDGGPTGNVEKAKELLGGKTIDLTYAFPNIPVRQQMAAKTKETYAKVGINIVLAPLDPNSYYKAVGTKGNQYDLIRGGWGADWPSASTVFPALFDGRTIRESGNQNLAYINEAEINSEIDRIKGLKVDQAAGEWAKLDKMIMEKYAPVIPQYYINNYEIHGSKIGGTFLSDSYGHMTLSTMFVKP